MTRHPIKSAFALALLASSIAFAAIGATKASTFQHLASFAPSNTELIYSIDAADKLVGVCSFCDYPVGVKSKQVVGNFVSANLERLARLKPDLIVLVSGQEGLAGMLAHNGYTTRVLPNHHIQDISANIRQLASLTDNTARGASVASNFEECLSNLSKIIKRSPKQPKVFYCVWPAPLLTIGQGSYLTDVITTCGGTSISKDLSADYPHFSLERLLINNPDVIVMPYECKDHSFLTKHPWTSLKAVKSNSVFFLPPAAEDGLARPTLRLPKGIYWLATKIHPEFKADLQSWYASASKNMQEESPK